MKEMKEIDLKKTPLSEIDLSNVDYEKSYIMIESVKQKSSRKLREIVHYDGSFDIIDKTDEGHHFYDDGKWCYGDEKTLHLFYKEYCKTCEFEVLSRTAFPCRTCSLSSKSFNLVGERNNWQPKESVKESNTPEYKWIKRPLNPHPIVIEYQDLGDTVKIVKIEGVMSCEEIEQYAGTYILNKYIGGLAERPGMYMDKTNTLYVWCIKDNQTYCHKIEIGTIKTKESFFHLIEQMKLASKRLSELIKESQPKIERIEI